MRKPKYKWIYDENDYQRYYDVSIGNDYLCVFENKWHPGVWMGMYNGIIIHDKTENDRQRKNKVWKKDATYFF